VARVVRRYGAGGSFWRAHPELPRLPATHFELWNEPYLNAFTNNDVDPARYAALVKAATTAGRAANPRARFLMAAETFYTAAPGDDRSWIDALYEAQPDLGRYFDAVAVHPYSSHQSPALYTGGPDTRFQFGRIAEIVGSLTAHGAVGKPLWITEIGWATCPGSDDCISEARQRSHVTTLFDEIRAKHSTYVEAVFYYHLHDFGAGDPDDKEEWFGLLRRDGSRKPAWHALRAQTGG